jgi:hypothetical protein
MPSRSPSPRGSASSLSAAGLRLLESARTPEQVEAALEAVPSNDPGIRPVLLRRYQAIATQEPRKDQGAAIRTALLKALRPCVQAEDAPLLEAALWTYEFMPNPGGERDEVAGGLRGAALIALNDVDAPLAAFHAARLLIDPHTSRFSGEPALTAVRVLSQQDQALLLYEYAARGGGGEVMAECLRALSSAPPSVVRRLVEGQLATRDEIALLGVIDLLIAHSDRSTFTPVLIDFLRATALLDVYRYGVHAMVAARRPDLIAELGTLAESERRQAQLAILREALGLPAA